MNKIGLVTCFVDNYGACLQAYALQQVLKNFGQCEIIRYSPYKQYCSKGLLYNFLEELKNLRRLIKYDNYSYELARKRKFDNFRKNYLLFSNDYYDSIEKLYKTDMGYDVYVTGSDQLWNPIIHNNSNNKAYFLDFVPYGKSRIAYAPSIGISQLPDNKFLKSEMRDLLMKFNALSTREETGATIVKGLTNRECRVVLDPTLLLENESWSEIAVKPIINRPYIFCYLFGEQDYFSDFISRVQKKTGWDVVVIPFTEREFKSNYKKIKGAGPLEFIGFIKNASMVITDSFHATAFSINFNVPFYSLLRNTTNEKNNMNSRIFDILDMVNLTDRIIDPEEFTKKEINFNLDFSIVNRILSEKREKDIKFIKDNLKI